MNIQSPYQVGIAHPPNLAQGSVMPQVAMINHENELSKAPAILPDPLCKITPLLGDIFTSLLQVRSILKQSINNPVVDPVKLDLIVARIDDINKEIIDLATSLDIMSL